MEKGSEGEGSESVGEGREVEMCMESLATGGRDVSMVVDDPPPPPPPRASRSLAFEIDSALFNVLAFFWGSETPSTTP